GMSSSTHTLVETTECDSISAPSNSSSSSTLSQEPWNKVQSSYAAKRKQMQAERMRQLKELEDQVAETSHWNQRRKDLVVSTSRRSLSEDNNIYPASTPSPGIKNKIDLGDATLEDLEDLIAASAKRLASYRLRNQSINQQEPLSPTTSRKKNSTDDLDRWKDILSPDHKSPHEKSPSASYQRLRSMFEKDHEPTLLSSKAHHEIIPRTKKTTHWKHNNITTTRSTMANATPKIESPRISSSTTPRATNPSFQLRKATRSHSYQRLADPSSIPTSIESKQGERPRKLSTLASLRQRQRQNNVKEDEEGDIKTIDDYIHSMQKTEEPKRKVKLSINASNTSTYKKTIPASEPDQTVASNDKTVRRKRGKTLPGNLTAPTSIAPLSLPPMKVEPLHIPQKNNRTIPKTPTRIPLPSSISSSTNKTPRLTRRNNETTDSSDEDYQKKTKAKQPITSRQLRKPKSSSTVSNTPKLQASRSNKSTDDNTLGKNVTVNMTPNSSSTTITASTSKRKVSTLQERLQGLVDESKSWATQMEKDKLKVEGQTSEIVLRGKGSVSEDKKIIERPSKIMMRVAMTPQAAQKLYQFNLTSFEKQEMMAYEHIYFVGHHAKKRPASPSHNLCNYGYDDERGDYLIQLRDHLDYRYEVLEVMGKGSFGQVLKCFDHRSGQTVAVKMIRNKKRFHAQALVEVKILEELIAWDPEDNHNNVRMLGHFMFRNHLCIAFECLSINLYEFIKSNNFQGFSMGLIRRFAMQLLNSLTLLQKHKLIHCDLKPENILLKHPTKSTIKVIDFGSSCLESEKVYTYIQSRFYRSPEVILGMSYSMAIDMWSLGCYPLFPGENEQEQLACIMEVQNVPKSYIIEKSSRRKLFFDSQGNPRIQPNSKGRKRRPGTKTLEHALKSTDEHFLDFINKCLQWDPDQRLKPDEALKHPWMLKSSSRKR
ncbi:hypothetical protein CU098_012961, partial [Rhizopus stolonifer]